ncbi:PRC-barrel domain protein [Roseivivax jejudonensis]|uniref:PRC-barrel domain protein n=1 Tax=Roseivivax jejudonensis TaxID=1529041 RepID=A0A1X6ZZ10_9RHOB|nr:PRC-barrel domain-containing protein [Roseivivax jejudonensis]SLN65774.1 PRC-barrel domain protein [Roseivivax jejudonensis]
MQRFAKSLILATVAGPAGVALGQTDETSPMGRNSGVVAEELGERFIRAEHIIGADIYTQSMNYDEAEWTGTDYYEEVDTDWEEVGEVSDIVISRDGEVVGVVAEVGGWLDIGDADIVIDIADLKTVGGSFEDAWGDLALVTPLTEEQLESRQEVDSGWW